MVNNPNRAAERDLDQWPFPDRESLALDFIESMPLDVPAVLSMERFTTMQTSRGCPWPCVFLRHPDLQPRQMAFAQPAHVVAEFKHLQEQRLRLRCTSSTIISYCNPSESKRSAKGSIDSGVTIQWGCEGRVDSVAQHLFPAMAKANCRTMMFGIESGSQKVLDRLKKEQTLEEVETAVTNAKQAGIEIVHGFFVVGNPDETVADLRATFDFAVEAPARHLRLQPPVRLSRHALVAGIRRPQTG